MTRRRKFNVGDLVILKRDVRVDDFPSSHFSPEAVQIVRSRTQVQRVITRLTSYRCNIPAGTAGIIKAFENVFMLDYDYLYPKTKPLDDQTIEVRNHAYRNRANKKHMIVLMNGQLIAVKPGAKLFERADDALARYETVDVTFQVTASYSRISKAELDAKIAKLTSRINAVEEVVTVSNVSSVRKLRDGIIEGTDGVPTH